MILTLSAFICLGVLDEDLLLEPVNGQDGEEALNCVAVIAAVKRATSGKSAKI